MDDPSGNANEHTINYAMDLLRQKWPELTDLQLVQKFVAATITAHEKSALAFAVTTKFPTVMVGGSTLCYGRHPETKAPSVVLIQRKEIGNDGEYQFGIPGGYINCGHVDIREDGVVIPHYGEQPADGAIRENHEELIDNHGKQLLDLTTERLRLVHNGIDESGLTYGKSAVYYSIYRVKLNDVEMNILLEHSKRIQADPAYQQAVYKHSQNEITNVVLMDIDKAAQLREDQFRYVHSLKAIQIAQRYVKRGFFRATEKQQLHSNKLYCIYKKEPNL